MHCIFSEEQHKIDLEVKVEDIILKYSKFKYISSISQNDSETKKDIIS